MTKPHRRAIVWFRNDLRLHDNEALVEALDHAQEVIPIYIFDDRIFNGKTASGFPRIGIKRAQFIIEAVQDLKSAFQERGINLIVRRGITEDILAELALKVKSRWVYCNRERLREEVLIQDSVEQKLWEIGQEIRYCRGKMLFYTADLPFPISRSPDTFKNFKKEVERFVPVREPLALPCTTFPILTIKVDETEVPTLEELGYDTRGFDADEAQFKGGESHGLSLLNSYIENASSESGSSHFSAYLGQGCLSPKFIYQELGKLSADKNTKALSQSLQDNLLKRDYLRLIAKKYGDLIFEESGLNGDDASWKGTDEDFARWYSGDTGEDYVDACMIELRSTGWLSHEHRALVARYLIEELDVNWLKGAEYFESQLIDFDPASNYGNWRHVAGLGTDDKDLRLPSLENRIDQLELDGSYTTTWLRNK